MNEIVIVRYHIVKETRCVIVQHWPLILREASLLERLAWWIHLKRCGAVVWMNDNMTWRAKKQAEQIIERVKA